MPACAGTFWCGKQTGELVTWDTDVDPGQVFSYWSGKTNTDGRVADLEAVLVDAGKTAQLTPWGNSAWIIMIQHSPYGLRSPSGQTFN